MEQESYSNMKNEKLTLIQTYHDEAKTKLWYEYQIDQFGRIQGEYKYLFENGQILEIGNHKNDNWHGKYQCWWGGGKRWLIDTRHFKKGEHGAKIIFKY